MIRTSLAVIAVIAAALSCCTNNKTQDRHNVANLPIKEIRDLSYAIKAAPSYRQDMLRIVEAMEDSLVKATDDTEKCRLALDLARRFRSTNTDSSLYYAQKAQALSATLSSDWKHKADISVITAYATAGLFTEAMGLFQQIDKEQLQGDALLLYWVAGRRLYGYMRGYAQGNRECYMKYDDRYQEFDDSLIERLPAADHWRVFLECERMVRERKYEEARLRLENLMEKLPPESNLYGMAAFQLAEVWKNLGNEYDYAAYLALSALSDVKGCVSEGLALPTLADWLYDNGELSDAFSFINFALEEASAGNARMRAVTIARFVPLIDDAYRNKINSSRDELMVYFILVTVLLIAAGVLAVILTKQVKRSRDNEKKLTQTSRRQESYIGNFIGLYSTYADRLNHFTRLVSNKLATGQTAELKKLVDSGRFSDQDNDDIYKIFDSAFLDIYPDFVSQINTLLRPEDAVEVKSKGSLTPELRIYAFVKLGIEESTRIAQILHYSTNTVYAYRNKMRNKALKRDTFDADVKAL